ncbi:MAG: extra-cytoplasmic solute receptor [Hyphomicrobiales bacterium]|nr:extra-cytoplasmic solute receptor [Hyphomicrobiales bacterium]
MNTPLAASTRLLSAVAFSAALLGFAPPAPAQGAANFPSQTITIVVSYAAGGPPDVAARMIAPAMSTILGKPVVIENRTGASTAIGTQAVARAAPDGHTLLMADSALTVAPNILANPGFDPQKDFAPVAPLLRTYMTLVVHPSVPAKSVQELIAFAKGKPGELKYGTSGIGTPPYLGALAFIQATGVEMLHVPYRGVALALNDMVAGHLSLVFVSQSTAASQVQGGGARVLGVFGEKRHASLPDVPTFREVGLDTRIMDEGIWFGIVAPAGTPPAIVDKLNAAINAAVSEPATKSRLAAADFHVSGGSPADLRKTIDENTVYWREAFKRAGVIPQ